MIGADLRYVNFSEGNLSGTNFLSANPTEAVMLVADLRGVRLTGANMKEVNMRHANLERTILRRAALDFADLKEAKLCNTIIPNGVTAIKDF